MIRWSHRYFLEFASSRYLNTAEQVEGVYGDLADYFSGQCVLPQTGGEVEHSKCTLHIIFNVRS